MSIRTPRIIADSSATDTRECIQLATDVISECRSGLIDGLLIVKWQHAQRGARRPVQTHFAGYPRRNADAAYRGAGRLMRAIEDF